MSALAQLQSIVTSVVIPSRTTSDTSKVIPMPTLQNNVSFYNPDAGDITLQQMLTLGVTTHRINQTRNQAIIPYHRNYYSPTEIIPMQRYAGFVDSISSGQGVPEKFDRSIFGVHRGPYIAAIYCNDPKSFSTNNEGALNQSIGDQVLVLRNNISKKAFDHIRNNLIDFIMKKHDLNQPTASQIAQTINWSVPCRKGIFGFNYLLANPYIADANGHIYPEVQELIMRANKQAQLSYAKEYANMQVEIKSDVTWRQILGSKVKSTDTTAVIKEENIIFKSGRYNIIHKDKTVTLDDVAVRKGSHSLGAIPKFNKKGSKYVDGKIVLKGDGVLTSLVSFKNENTGNLRFSSVLKMYEHIEKLDIKGQTCLNVSCDNSFKFDDNNREYIPVEKVVSLYSKFNKAELQQISQWFEPSQRSLMGGKMENPALASQRNMIYQTLANYFSLDNISALNECLASPSKNSKLFLDMKLNQSDIDQINKMPEVVKRWFYESAIDSQTEMNGAKNRTWMHTKIASWQRSNIMSFQSVFLDFEAFSGWNLVDASLADTINKEFVLAMEKALKGTGIHIMCAGGDEFFFVFDPEKWHNIDSPENIKKANAYIDKIAKDVVANVQETSIKVNWDNILNRYQVKKYNGQEQFNNLNDKPNNWWSAVLNDSQQINTKAQAKDGVFLVYDAKEKIVVGILTADAEGKMIIGDSTRYSPKYKKHFLGFNADPKTSILTVEIAPKQQSHEVYTTLSEKGSKAEGDGIPKDSSTSDVSSLQKPEENQQTKPVSNKKKLKNRAWAYCQKVFTELKDFEASRLDDFMKKHGVNNLQTAELKTMLDNMSVEQLKVYNTQIFFGIFMGIVSMHAGEQILHAIAPEMNEEIQFFLLAGFAHNVNQGANLLMTTALNNGVPEKVFNQLKNFRELKKVAPEMAKAYYDIARGIAVSRLTALKDLSAVKEGGKQLCSRGLALLTTENAGKAVMSGIKGAWFSCGFVKCFIHNMALGTLASSSTRNLLSVLGVSEESYVSVISSNVAFFIPDVVKASPFLAAWIAKRAGTKAAESTLVYYSTTLAGRLESQSIKAVSRLAAAGIALQISSTVTEKIFISSYDSTVFARAGKLYNQELINSDSCFVSSLGYLREVYSLLGFDSLMNGTTGDVVSFTDTIRTQDMQETKKLKEALKKEVLSVYAEHEYSDGTGCGDAERSDTNDIIVENVLNSLKKNSSFKVIVEQLALFPFYYHRIDPAIINDLQNFIASEDADFELQPETVAYLDAFFEV